MPPGGFQEFERPHHVREYSWHYIDAPRPREIKVHDIITIIVKEQAQLTVDSRFNRNRMANLRAELREFVRLDERRNLANAAENQPTIDGNLMGRLMSMGNLQERETVIYRIAAMVVDVRPNGNLILEARKLMRTNKDVWEYQLTGEVMADDVNRDNTALSERIYNLDVIKHHRGKVTDSIQRPWGVWLYDKFFPF